ncbi:MAG: glycosyltransferase family 4 protein [Candidatus Kapabacteria bacterium]|nr:glycosyltransferase family 4 protein [Candidatus Kapabacteria bacterium]
MKNILVIAYYFPPSGGPGGQRVLKTVKYLPDFGWQPYVLTVSNGQFPAIDESLLDEIPKSVVVERTRIFEPYDIYRKITGMKPGTAIDVNVIKKEGQSLSFKQKLAEFVRATFFIPDARIGWIFSAVKAGREMIKKYNIHAIYSSSPPYTCSMIARKLKRISNLPWVAGFRDPWTGFISTPKRWLIPAMIDKHFEKSVFQTADFVECAWEGIIKDALGKYPDLNPQKFIHIPNGFDSNDFPKIEIKPNEKFTITYTGSMYGRRNPDSFFQAIEKLIADRKINPDDLKLVFVGRFGDEIHDMFNKVSFKNSIQVFGYVPHKESVEFILRSDVLLLVVDESKESEEIVPGKVYEYIGTRKPVLAIAPNNSAIAKLIKETNSGLIAHQSEIDKIAANFLSFYEAWKNNKKLINPNENEINKYERRESARQLAGLLDSIIS